MPPLSRASSRAPLSPVAPLPPPLPTDQAADGSSATPYSSAPPTSSPSSPLTLELVGRNVPRPRHGARPLPTRLLTRSSPHFDKTTRTSTRGRAPVLGCGPVRADGNIPLGQGETTLHAGALAIHLKLSIPLLKKR